MINKLKYGQTWKIWPSTLGLSVYSTFKEKHSLSILGKKDLLFLTPNFFIFVSKRFAMLHVFYKQLKST